MLDSVQYQNPLIRPSYPNRTFSMNWSYLYMWYYKFVVKFNFSPQKTMTFGKPSDLPLQNMRSL